MISTCRVISCVVRRGCLLWPVHSLSKTLLVFALLHFVLQSQTFLLLQVFLDFLLLYSSPLWWKGPILGVLVLEGLLGLHRTIQLQLLQHYWSGHRLGLLWYWMVCLGNEQRSFCYFSGCIQVLKQKSCRKTSVSALLTMPKPLTVWITTNCGKFCKRWEYQTTWPASWETYMQVRKQQLELDMEQQTGSK